MLRRNFLKKILISTIGIIVMSNKLFAKEIFKKPIFKDGIFYNNYISHKMASFKEFWKWRKESAKPEPISFPLVKNDPIFLQQNRTQKTLTWIGHASFLLQVDGINILTDPHLTKRASPVIFAGPSRTTPPGLSIEDLPPIDIIVISHNHYDHLDYQTILKITRKQKDNQPLVLVPFFSSKSHIALIDGPRLFMFDLDLDNSYWLSQYGQTSGLKVPIGKYEENVTFFRKNAYNYPNPISDDYTTFRFYIDNIQTSEVQVKIYNSAGYLVKDNLFNKNIIANEFNEIKWENIQLDAGFYLAEVKPNIGQSELIRMVYIK